LEKEGNIFAQRITSNTLGISGTPVYEHTHTHTHTT